MNMRDSDIKFYGRPGDLSVDEAMEILNNCEHRVVKTEKEGFPFTKGHQWTSTEVQIFYRDEWMDICTTDLKDDVAVGPPCGSVPTFDSYVRKLEKSYGARIGEGHSGKHYFAVITHFSDG